MQLYEKRSRVVKENESHIWKDVLPSMMSEEEDDEEACGFRRRRQVWKSIKFCRFIDKLDQRLAKKKSSTNNPARDRSYGDKLEVAPPPVAKSWMKATTVPQPADESNQVEQNQSDNELFSDSEED